MRGRMRAGLVRLLGLVIGSAAPLTAQTSISRQLPVGTEVIANLVFARYGTRELKLDLYLPGPGQARTFHPVVVVRGGGWRQGDKEYFAPMAAALARRGIPAASIEYRPSDEDPFPAAVYDTKAAVRWLRANGERYGLDAGRVGAFGGSAGAHLVAYLAVTGDIPTLEGDGGSAGFASAVQAVVSLAAPSDLTAVEERIAPDTRAFLVDSFETQPAIWSFASPVVHVDSTAAPILLVHGEDDPVVPAQRSIDFAERYAQAGVPFELVMFPDAPHDFWNFEEWFESTMDRAAAFLLAHLTE
jgi:acetyl esterase/lipase